jgi:protein TonB
MEMTADASRHSASVAASLAVHVALALLLLGRGVVELTLQPTPIVLTFVQASTQTAGPGERAPQLRVAAPAPQPAVPEPEPVRAEPEPEIAKAPAEPVPVAKPKSAPKKPERARAVASAAPPVIQSAPVTAPGGTGEGGNGDAARASAPAWAPTARVRYEELLFAWMNRHKEYPMLAQRRGLEGRGSLRVRIGRDGRVLERVLVGSTGQPLLDQAALDMVRRASPFPAVPEGYAGPSFEFVAPIEYRLR